MQASLEGTFRVIEGGGSRLSSPLPETLGFPVGMAVDTPSGAVDVNDLRPGHLVFTMDEGARPVRAVRRHRVTAQGADAPVALGAQVLGNHLPVLLSPGQGVLFRRPELAVLFGEREVLVTAGSFRQCDTGHQIERGLALTYVEIDLGRPQILRCNGLYCASHTGSAPPARRMLTDQEVGLLFGSGAVVPMAERRNS